MRLHGNLILSGGVAASRDHGSVTLSTLQATATGTVSPVYRWNTTEFRGEVGLSYSW